MAKLPSVNIFNEERKKALKIQSTIGEAMIITVDETKECLKDFIRDELSFFAEDVSKKRSLEIEEKLNLKLNQVEASMIKFINDKIDKITDRIVELSINRVIEQEVEKRLNEK